MHVLWLHVHNDEQTAFVLNSHAKTVHRGIKYNYILMQVQKSLVTNEMFFDWS